MTPGIAEPIGWERALLAAEKVKECLGDGVAADDRVRHAGPVQRARRAAQVARVDEDAVRNTKDVDILVRRADFPAVRAALEAVGFIYHHVWGVDASTDGPQGKPSGGILVGSGKFFWRIGVVAVKIGFCVRNPCPRPVMEPMPKLDRAAYVAGMREQLEAMLGRVADAINDARDGEIIAGSERPVFDLFAEFRQNAFEAGLQMRTDAAEAAFSPSGGNRVEETPAE